MKPSFPKDPVMRNEAGKIIMEAIVRSDPHGKPTWFHEKKEVKDGGRFHMGSEEQKDGTILYSLAVTTPKKEDAGAYTLTVTNKSGDNSAKFSLNVGPPPGSGDIAPEFSSDPKIYANADNSLITLECIYIITRSCLCAHLRLKQEGFGNLGRTPENADDLTNRAHRISEDAAKVTDRFQGGAQAPRSTQPTSRTACACVAAAHAYGGAGTQPSYAR
ncbi:PREDICTED: disorganized muscle protein 1-like [Priapulus caudatus]|uniref:Disorganized muscle protein 1-like n=1 Tax=Priapulus caudatus TaxID=37621 RepID=A0ABM1ESH7_PRICU|nr:PREDICTED: disorganized muscle protein 1-like [Priapulus caudatus]